MTSFVRCSLNVHCLKDDLVAIGVERSILEFLSFFAGCMGY